jgi:hypothetical protein
MYLLDPQIDKNLFQVLNKPMFGWLKPLFILVNLLFASLNLASVDINVNCHEHEEACVELATDNFKVAETTQTNNEKDHSHDNCANCHHSSCGLRNANLSSNEFKFSCPTLEIQETISTYKLPYSDVDSEGPFWPPKA